MKTRHAFSLFAMGVAMLAAPLQAQREAGQSDDPFNADDFNPVPKVDPWLLKNVGDLMDDLGAAAVEQTKGRYEAWRQERAAAAEAERQAEIAAREQAEALAVKQMNARGFTRDQIAAVLAYMPREEGLWQQANRLFSDARSFDFIGHAEDDGDEISYYGRKEGAFVVGNYTLTLWERQQQNSYSGSFAGTVSRFNTATGAYINGPEYGTFSGVFSDRLDTIFAGGFTCTGNCDD